VFSNFITYFNIIWLCFLGLTLGFFYLKLYLLKQRQHWPSIQGQIIQLHWETKGQQIWPQLVYIYEVNNQNYSGDALFLNANLYSIYSQPSRETAYKAAMAFKNKEPITVFYNPNQPSQSTLTTHTPPKIKKIIIVLTVIFFLHVTFMFYR